MEVSLDWNSLGKAVLDIKVTKAPSENPTKSPLFVNPGGLDIEGGTSATNLRNDKWRGYDIVTWNSRGSGESAHVQHGTTERMNKTYFAGGIPDDEAEKTVLNDV